LIGSRIVVAEGLCFRGDAPKSSRVMAVSYYRVDVSTFRSDEVRAPGKEVAAVTQKCYDGIGAELKCTMPVRQNHGA